MEALGFEVHDKVGGHGLVCILRNGPGDTVMYRVEMDALEIQEKTGLPYASQRHVANRHGDTTWYSHACSHDMHMAVWLGTANMLAQFKTHWSGTVVMIAQPSEENGEGAKAMIADGLFKRFPRPKCAVALHDDAGLESGKVGLVAGAAMANTLGLDITLRGKSAHGGYPHHGIDVIVMLAKVILSLQAIVSRELEPGTPAVITIGKVTAGTRRNQLPDEAKMELTIRSYDPAVSTFIVRRIKEVCDGSARAAGVSAERMPTVSLVGHATPAVVNDEHLTVHAVKVLRAVLGEERVERKKPVMGGEDFSQYRQAAPILLFWLGTVSAEAMNKHKSTGEPLPSLHSSEFAPVLDTTLFTGVKAMSAVLFSLLKK
jgi:amidohydrolase